MYMWGVVIARPDISLHKVSRFVSVGKEASFMEAQSPGWLSPFHFCYLIFIVLCFIFIGSKFQLVLF